MDNKFIQIHQKKLLRVPLSIEHFHFSMEGHLKLEYISQPNNDEIENKQSEMLNCNDLVCFDIILMEWNH